MLGTKWEAPSLSRARALEVEGKADAASLAPASLPRTAPSEIDKISTEEVLKFSDAMPRKICSFNDS